MLENIVYYIDGFNLYFGISDSGWGQYKWLDINALANNLTKPNQNIVEVNYFTSRVRNAPDKEKRQNTYLEALQEYSKVNIYYGRYQPNYIHCYRCGNVYSSPNEKMTDVNIAVRMLVDAYQDKYDAALLISGDSDLIPPIKEIHRIFPTKRVTIGFPPKRHNFSMATVAKGSFIIGRKKLKDSQLPKEITKSNGYKLIRPKEWT